MDRKGLKKYVELAQKQHQERFEKSLITEDRIKEAMKCFDCDFYKDGICHYMPDVDMTGCIKDGTYSGGE